MSTINSDMHNIKSHPKISGGRRSKYDKKGGSGAGDYAVAVYGNSDAQHAQTGSNVIAANQVRTGGNVLNDIAVPAVLLYANYKYGKKKQNVRFKTFRKKGRKQRRSRRRR